MERFDVAVVGGGPAGSTTAYRLARAHARVLLVDKVRFPRDKPCGGGLTMRAVRELPFSVDPVVEDRITRVRCRLKYGRVMNRASEHVLCLMTQRRRLDSFLVEQAVEAGVAFRDGVRVDVESDRRVRVDGKPIQVDAVVGADGANGVTAKVFGLGGAIVNGVALEGNLPYERLPLDDWRGMLVLELAALPGGYGWIFPKGDHVNVGVGGDEAEGPRLRAELRRMCEAYGVDPDAAADARGYRLPMRTAATSLVGGNAALIGDAAGLVDPLSGDGIYEAFLSAKLVADAILADELGRYEHELRRALSSQLAAAWGAKVALDRFPRLTYAAVRSPFLWKAIVSLMLGVFSLGLLGSIAICMVIRS